MEHSRPGHGAFEALDIMWVWWSMRHMEGQTHRPGRWAGPKSRRPVSPAEVFESNPGSTGEPQRTQNKEWQDLGAYKG